MRGSAPPPPPKTSKLLNSYSKFIEYRHRTPMANTIIHPHLSPTPEKIFGIRASIYRDNKLIITYP